MAIAVLTDIHGNSVALDAVVADARSAGARRWWLLGDLVALGPDPAGTASRLRDLDAEVRVMGNTDRYVLRDEIPFAPLEELDLTPQLVEQMTTMAATLAWAKGALAGSGHLDWLAAATPNHRGALADGTTVLAVHAGPTHDSGPGISPALSHDELVELFDGETAGLILGGHTHHVTDRTIDSRRFINPGSVSNHLTADRRAHYALIHETAEGHQIELRAVEYDTASVMTAFTESGLPGGAQLRERFYR